MREEEGARQKNPKDVLVELGPSLLVKEEHPQTQEESSEAETVKPEHFDGHMIELSPIGRSGEAE